MVQRSDYATGRLFLKKTEIIFHQISSALAFFWGVFNLFVSGLWIRRFCLIKRPQILTGSRENLSQYLPLSGWSLRRRAAPWPSVLVSSADRKRRSGASTCHEAGHAHKAGALACSRKRVLTEKDDATSIRESLLEVKSFLLSDGRTRRPPPWPHAKTSELSLEVFWRKKSCLTSTVFPFLHLNVMKTSLIGSIYRSYLIKFSPKM